MPEIRVNVVKRAVGEAKRLPEIDRAKVFERLGETTRCGIRDAPLLAWVDAGVWVTFTLAIEQALGAERARAFWKSYLLDALNRPLLKPLRVGALAMYGRQPAALLRRAPQAWALITRDCGTIGVEFGEGVATLSISRLPDVFRRSSSVLSFWQGGAEACIAYFDRAVRSTCNAAELAAGSARVELRWV